MNLKDFEGRSGFNPERNNVCLVHNQKLVIRHKKEFISAKEYNTGKLVLPPKNDFPTDEIIFRDYNSTLI